MWFNTLTGRRRYLFIYHNSRTLILYFIATLILMGKQIIIAMLFVCLFLLVDERRTKMMAFAQKQTSSVSMYILPLFITNKQPSSLLIVN